MRKTLLFTLCLLVVFQSSTANKKKMMQKMNNYNLFARCFGEKFMSGYALAIWKSTEFCEEIKAPIFDTQKTFNDNSANQKDNLNALIKLISNSATLLGNKASRKKRQANGGFLNLDENDKMEFLEDVSVFKEDMHTKIGNLSCVLTQMEMLDAEGKINMAGYRLETLVPLLGNSPAGSDPLFLKKLADGYSDCEAISRTWPKASLERHSTTEIHGRHMIFFECTKKVEETMCTKFQILQWLETLYGKANVEQNVKIGLPADKYEAAVMSLNVLEAGASKEEAFVDDFFWQGSKF